MLGCWGVSQLPTLHGWDVTRGLWGTLGLPGRERVVSAPPSQPVGAGNGATDQACAAPASPSVESLA